jgi:hypothetical protein
MAGLYLTTAVICERVDIADDGAVSIIRIFDQIEFGHSELTAAYLNLYFAFHADEAQPETPISILVETPSREKYEVVTTTLVFKSNQQGAPVQSAAFQMELYTGFLEVGLYWFHVDINGEFFVRLPLRVVVAAH